MKSVTPASCLLLALWTLAALPSCAADVYTRPGDFPRAEGPSVLQITQEDARREGGSRRGATLPRMEIRVVDGEGRGVAGVGVRVNARIGKSRGNTIRRTGATDEDGRFLLDPEPITGITKLALVFSWAGGARTVGANLEPQGRRGGPWRIEEAPYKTVADYEDAGNCSNLFELQPGDGEDTLRLLYRLPETLLECREVEYGRDRKTDQLARVGQIARRDVNAGDKNRFSPEDERRMGLEASREFDRQFEILDHPEINAYVRGVMDKVVAASDQPDMPVNLRVIHTDAVNAFVTAGGHVYVFTGLIAAAENESQLAGVLAHEASHAIARHVTEGATRQMKIQLPVLLGSLALGELADLESGERQALMMGSMVGAGLVGMKFGRADETEADLLGAQYLWQAGWDPEGIARFFQVLSERPGGSPPAWLSTHPSHEKRIENGIQWNRAFLPARERYLVDTDEFRRIQELVRQLPPPRKKPEAENTVDLQQALADTPTFRHVAGSLLGEGIPGN